MDMREADRQALRQMFRPLWADGLVTLEGIEHPFVGQPLEVIEDDGLSHDQLIHVRVQGSTFNGWVPVSNLVRYEAPEQETSTLLSMTNEQIIFAQMRGILLHLDATDGWEQDFSIQNGKAALDIWEQYREWPQFHALSEAFEGLGDTSDVDQRFIAYWDSFLTQEQDDYDPNPVNDDFPLSLEHPHENDESIYWESIQEREYYGEDY